MISEEWMYGPNRNVRVSKLTGEAQRKYMNPKEAIVWLRVDGVTFGQRPSGLLRNVRSEERLWAAQSAL